MSFVHIATQDSLEGTNRLTELSAFTAFTAGIKDRCEDPPVSAKLTEVGSYEFFGALEGRR